MNRSKYFELKNLVRECSRLQEGGVQIELGRDQKGQLALYGKKYQAGKGRDQLKRSNSKDVWEKLEPGTEKYKMGLEAYRKAKSKGLVPKLEDFNTATSDFEIDLIDDSVKVNFDKGGSVKI